MRIIVYGIGAVGGTIAARLCRAGVDVVGIARGRMLEAIRGGGGLELTTIEGTETARFPCFGDPAEVGLRSDDIVLLTMKAQDTEAALARLRLAGAYGQPVICAQNGVANERMALRHFPNVYGMLVMMPAQYTTPGRVECFGAPAFGLFDLGRYPHGTDAVCHDLAAALTCAGFNCEVRDEVMVSKHAKLLLNVGNIVDAALGGRARFGRWYDAARREAEAVFEAAGIAFGNVDFDSPRRALMQTVKLPGIERSGSSSQQSLARGAGSIETDYLNGEIVLLGRLNGLETPVNAALCRVARRMLAEGMPPGSFPEAALAEMVAAS